MVLEQQKLEEALAFFDEQLHSAFLIKRLWYQKYEEENKKESFEINQFLKGYEDVINQWLNVVAKYIFERFEKHLYFHFLEPKKGSSMSFTHPLGNLTYSFELHMYALEDVIVRLEERRSLAIRQEIAEKEYETDTLYKITFSWHTREIKLNNILLARPNSDSKNLNFFEYVYGNPNKPIEVVTIEKTVGQELANNIHDILRDLNFVGNLRTIFFPIATKSKVMFSNPITKQYAIKNDLPVIDFSKITRHSEK